MTFLNDGKAGRAGGVGGRLWGEKRGWGWGG